MKIWGGDGEQSMIRHLYLSKVILKGVPKSAVPAAPGNWLEMQMIRPYPRTPESDALWVENAVFLVSSELILF